MSEASSVNSSVLSNSVRESLGTLKGQQLDTLRKQNSIYASQLVDLENGFASPLKASRTQTTPSNIAVVFQMENQKLKRELDEMKERRFEDDETMKKLNDKISVYQDIQVKFEDLMIENARLKEQLGQPVEKDEQDNFYQMQKSELKEVLQSLKKKQAEVDDAWRQMHIQMKENENQKQIISQQRENISNLENKLTSYEINFQNHFQAKFNESQFQQYEKFKQATDQLSTITDTCKKLQLENDKYREEYQFLQSQFNNKETNNQQLLNRIQKLQAEIKTVQGEYFDLKADASFVYNSREKFVEEYENSIDSTFLKLKAKLHEIDNENKVLKENMDRILVYVQNMQPDASLLQDLLPIQKQFLHLKTIVFGQEADVLRLTQQVNKLTGKKDNIDDIIFNRKNQIRDYLGTVPGHKGKYISAAEVLEIIEKFNQKIHLLEEQIKDPEFEAVVLQLENGQKDREQIQILFQNANLHLETLKNEHKEELQKLQMDKTVVQNPIIPEENKEIINQEPKEEPKEKDEKEDTVEIVEPAENVPEPVKQNE
ncbi:Hypothetical_protein [Hexamita inflata]|uniref:Hypothetical_protein n=1 Tax=Hexamita inflata TaxID=28002 RepID=A0AA86QKX2_9EUKA|nr:Hypothetical protein HINF_LOCUS49114 [Hexamita inflata]